MKFILNISIYLYFLKVIKTLHPMVSMWSVFYTYTDLWYFVPVGILTGDLLEVDPALPMMVPAESSCYLKALMHYESLVALEGS